MLKLTQSIEFKNNSCEFQNQLSRDANKIRKDKNMIIAADKTTNFYRMDTNSYKQLREANTTKSYKKAPPNSVQDIISKEKQIAEKRGLDNRIDALAKKDAFITVKDHKPNFQNNPACRLINPTKSEIGIISKQILERVNQKVVEATGVNQWKNTQAVLEWYKNIPNKNNHSFISFNVVDFYPSITENLLIEALNFASKYDNITDEEKALIIQAKQSLLFNDNEAWCKKSSITQFDVTIGRYDSAETCVLVGSYLLSKLSPQYRKKLGLYRDDGFGAFDETTRKIEIIKKLICRTFADHNLKLTSEANKKCVHFLDVTLDMRTGTFKPYTKPGNTIQYVNSSNNYPPSILRSIPEAINRRLSAISSDKKAFVETVQPYQEALTKSGYKFKLNFKPPEERKKRTRNRNVVWFNPPYSCNVATNIGRKFLRIIDESFPPNACPSKDLQQKHGETLLQLHA